MRSLKEGMTMVKKKVRRKKEEVERVPLVVAVVQLVMKVAMMTT